MHIWSGIILRCTLDLLCTINITNLEYSLRIRVQISTNIVRIHHHSYISCRIILCYMCGHKILNTCIIIWIMTNNSIHISISIDCISTLFSWIMNKVFIIILRMILKIQLIIIIYRGSICNNLRTIKIEICLSEILMQLMIFCTYINHFTKLRYLRIYIHIHHIGYESKQWMAVLLLQNIFIVQCLIKLIHQVRKSIMYNINCLCL